MVPELLTLGDMAGEIILEGAADVVVVEVAAAGAAAVPELAGAGACACGAGSTAGVLGSWAEGEVCTGAWSDTGLGGSTGGRVSECGAAVPAVLIARSSTLLLSSVVDGVLVASGAGIASWGPGAAIVESWRTTETKLD